MNNKQQHFCNNCGKYGHVFSQCKHPITSLGFIVYRIRDNNILEYLLIRRKNTLGFIDFMRGKYDINNKSYILNIINEMTINEKKKLLNNNFNELWKYLWGENVGLQYRSEEIISKEKINLLKKGVKVKNKTYTLSSLIKESTTKWKEPEWGFPKGRRNYQENDISCALREFSEETGIQKNNVILVKNFIPFDEIFTGSNYKSYKHRYFIGYMRNCNLPCNIQKSEVSQFRWMNLDESIKAIRPYNLERIQLLKNIENVLLKYSLIS